MSSSWSEEILNSYDEMGTRLMCHNDAIACIGEGRAAAGDFMKEAASILTDHSSELSRVSRLYHNIAGLAGKMIETQGGFRGEEGKVVENLKRPETRKILVSQINSAIKIEEDIAAILRNQF